MIDGSFDDINSTSKVKEPPFKFLFHKDQILLQKEPVNKFFKPEDVKKDEIPVIQILK